MDKVYVPDEVRDAYLEALERRGFRLARLYRVLMDRGMPALYELCIGNVCTMHYPDEIPAEALLVEITRRLARLVEEGFKRYEENVGNTRVVVFASRAVTVIKRTSGDTQEMIVYIPVRREGGGDERQTLHTPSYIT